MIINDYTVCVRIVAIGQAEILPVAKCNVNRYSLTPIFIITYLKSHILRYVMCAL